MVTSMAARPLGVSMRSTNERSISSTLRGSTARRPRELYPVPKSSIATDTPAVDKSDSSRFCDELVDQDGLGDLDPAWREVGGSQLVH